MSDMSDMSEIQDSLQDYARTDTFCYNSRNTLEMRQLYKKVDSCSCTIENPVCGDSLTLHMYRSNKNLFSVFHEGRYCALVHASSEILCQMLHQKTQDYITSVIDNSLNFSDDTKNKELKTSDKIHEIFVYMFSRTILSAFRKQCFLLPYRGCDIINEKISKSEVTHV